MEKNLKKNIYISVRTNRRCQSIEAEVDSESYREVPEPDQK